jgi:hypothetical protein
MPVIIAQARRSLIAQHGGLKSYVDEPVENTVRDTRQIDEGIERAKQKGERSRARPSLF